MSTGAPVADAVRLPRRRGWPEDSPVPARPGGDARQGDRVREGDRRARKPDPVPAQGLARRAEGGDREHEAAGVEAPRRDRDHALARDPRLDRSAAFGVRRPADPVAGRAHSRGQNLHNTSIQPRCGDRVGLRMWGMLPAPRSGRYGSVDVSCMPPYQGRRPRRDDDVGPWANVTTWSDRGTCRRRQGKSPRICWHGSTARFPVASRGSTSSGRPAWGRSAQAGATSTSWRSSIASFRAVNWRDSEPCTSAGGRRRSFATSRSGRAGRSCATASTCGTATWRARRSR